MKIDYPKEWDELPKRERKQKIRELKKKTEKKQNLIIKTRNIAIVVVLVVFSVLGYLQLTKKSPEEIAFEQEVGEVSLDSRVEEFEIEGANHIGAGQTVAYNTNPPTSGSHWANPADWGFNDEGLPDEQLVHNIEHGGIWITYKGLDEVSLDKLRNVANNNNDSVVITKREENDDQLVVASWGRMMKLMDVDEALIQKYIDTYINQSPEKLAK
jgi:hypothetical protein